jgi:hypothetical protein
MPQEEANKIRISAEPEELKGRYANAFAVVSQEREVAIDFISIVNNPEHSEGRIVSRIFLNRFTVQDLITTLQQNMAQWEKVRYSAPPEQPGAAATDSVVKP